MSDPYRRARPGDELAIPASTWNTAIDAAKAYRDAAGAVGGSETPRSGWIVPVLNDTGSDLPRASVVGLAGPIFPPSVSLDAFLQGAAFRGVVPDASHANRFAVTLVPIPAGQVGRAFVSGVFQARIDILDESHTCAHASEGDTEKLVSGSGPAQILWKESGTGTKWAIVRRVGSCGPLPTPEPEPEPAEVACCPGRMIPGNLDFAASGGSGGWSASGQLAAVRPGETLYDAAFLASGWPFGTPSGEVLWAWHGLAEVGIHSRWLGDCGEVPTPGFCNSIGVVPGSGETLPAAMVLWMGCTSGGSPAWRMRGAIWIGGRVFEHVLGLMPADPWDPSGLTSYPCCPGGDAVFSRDGGQLMPVGSPGCSPKFAATFNNATTFGLGWASYVGSGFSVTVAEP